MIYLLQHAKKLIREKRRLFILLSFLASLMLGSCSQASIGSANPARSIRPIVKIGLIAPFEGLYRRTGYEALAAMRAALTDHAALMQAANIDILPLALDDSGDPDSAARTAQKLLADPAVGALVGPISPWTSQAVAATLTSSSVKWVRPFLANQNETDWVISLITAISQAAKKQGAERLLIAGWVKGWPEKEAPLWREIDGLPHEFIAVDLADAQSLQEELRENVQATDALLFLGAPADAATYLAALRQEHESVPFWVGSQGGSPILFERAALINDSRVHSVYWATMLDSGYNDWRNTHQPATPSAYLIYRATERALHSVILRHSSSISQLKEQSVNEISTESGTNLAETQDNLIPQIRFFSIEESGISVDYIP